MEGGFTAATIAKIQRRVEQKTQTQTQTLVPPVPSNPQWISTRAHSLSLTLCGTLLPSEWTPAALQPPFSHTGAGLVSAGKKLHASARSSRTALAFVSAGTGLPATPPLRPSNPVVGIGAPEWLPPRTASLSMAASGTLGARGDAGKAQRVAEVLNPETTRGRAFAALFGGSSSSQTGSRTGSRGREGGASGSGSSSFSTAFSASASASLSAAVSASSMGRSAGRVGGILGGASRLNRRYAVLSARSTPSLTAGPWYLTTPARSPISHTSLSLPAIPVSPVDPPGSGKGGKKRRRSQSAEPPSVEKRPMPTSLGELLLSNLPLAPQSPIISPSSSSSTHLSTPSAPILPTVSNEEIGGSAGLSHSAPVVGSDSQPGPPPRPGSDHASSSSSSSSSLGPNTHPPPSFHMSQAGKRHLQLVAALRPQ